MARHLITSAIPYINGIKHLGNLVGSQLPADLYARYLRARGEEVLFLCATDEHGTPAELAAAKAGKPVEAYCAEMHEVQAEIAQGFGLSFDHFGRSSSVQNQKLTQHFAGVLADEGLIEEVTEKQVYSIADGRFLPDRYIEGTCPNCGFTSARGDQCDSCTKQLDPVDLIDARSTISGSTELEMRDTKHLFLRQSLMKDRLDAWINEKTDWPVLTTSIARKWLHDGDGLQDRGITRDLNWGVPVKRGDAEWPGMEGKVFYVWFDAPIEYIACAQEWADAAGGANPEKEWARWWRIDQ
ncbi:MAG: class I tRNA ligase family protein, partial [Sulfitobacter sp.]|nr:class I tRNA ligase family protein [Sulfitobacter sp.]